MSKLNDIAQNTKKNILMEARDIITNYHGPKLRIMEVCGTHTHEIFRLGIRQLLQFFRSQAGFGQGQLFGVL